MALVIQICGLSAEDGIVIPQGVAKVRQVLPALLEDAENAPPGRRVRGPASALRTPNPWVEATERKLRRVVEPREACQRLAQLEGMEPRVRLRILPNH